MAVTARGTSRFDRGTVAKNIESILKLEENDERQLSPLHRVSHQVGWFVGTIYFVIIQAVLVFSLGISSRRGSSIRIRFRFFPQFSPSKRYSSHPSFSSVKTQWIGSRNGEIILICRSISWLRRKRPAFSKRLARLRHILELSSQPTARIANWHRILRFRVLRATCGPWKKETSTKR